MPGNELIRWTHALQGDLNLAGVPRLAGIKLAMVGDHDKILARRIRWLDRQYLNGALRLVRLASAAARARSEQMAAQMVEFQTEIPNSGLGGQSV